MKKRFLFGASFLLLLTLPQFAQNSNQTTNQNNAEADEKNSDLVITATVKAKELKFEAVPNPKVEFPGSKPRQTVWESDRANLPEKVEPGVIYRDIGIRLRIFSRFTEIQRIVLEALGEENSAARQNQIAPTDSDSRPANQNNQTIKPPR